MSAATITFGDCAENHAGMQRLGAMAAAGLSVRDLALARQRFEAAGFGCQTVDLVAEGNVAGLDPAPAQVLIVRNGVSALLPAGSSATDLHAEHAGLTHDARAFMRGRVVNKHARHNLCFGDGVDAQEPDYALGKGRIVAFDAVPLTHAARTALPALFGAKAAALYAEANYYYDVQKCGIGFHGDSERRIVVALRLGTAIPLHYQWYHRSKPVGNRIALALQHGDLYAMSEKAVGTDWHRKLVPTLRHAAGAKKFLRLPAAHAAD
eukprot:gnl/Hemi2/11224_TR3878_c0_g1_i1.p2 gnl/Hemi2/11224_TR3878_c0_g1~~gnl/Hemi2/11224_TR3878_c0_g1_i1.p2  ORF type:complete len:287 (-),score=125.78 gnl/Hemi2/11224_TR3878_c0_g1_i1:129-923(-)